MMNKEQKKNYIEEMTSKFESSKAVMVTHYQGLNDSVRWSKSKNERAWYRL